MDIKVFKVMITLTVMSTSLLALAGGFEAVQDYWHTEAVRCLAEMGSDRVRSIDLAIIQYPLEVVKSGLEFGFAGIQTHPKPFTLTDMSIMALYVSGFKEYGFRLSIPEAEVQFWQASAKESIRSPIAINWEVAVRIMIRNRALLEAERRYSVV
jgi:hypothetical protein